MSGYAQGPFDFEHRPEAFSDWNYLLLLRPSEFVKTTFMKRPIFFVDDDKVILHLMEFTFQNRQDYDVLCFHTGEECLENLSLEPRLIVLDHILAGAGENRLNGLDTLKEIRKVNTEVPVVILTGQGDEDLLTEFMDNGANRYLTKDDFFIDSVIETIQEVLR